MDNVNNSAAKIRGKAQQKLSKLHNKLTKLQKLLHNGGFCSSFIDYLANNLYFCNMLQQLFSYLPTFVCAFWALNLMLLYHEKKSEATAILSGFMYVAMILYFGHAVFFHKNLAALPVTDTLYNMAQLSVYPLYYIYLSRLTSISLSPKFWRLGWILVPAILMGISIGCIYWLMSEDERLRFCNEVLYHNHLVYDTPVIAWQTTLHLTNRILFTLQVVLFITQGLRKLRKYNETIPNVYVDADERKLTALSHLLIFFCATSIVSFLFNIIGRHHFNSGSLIAIPSLIFSLLLFLLGYVGARLHHLLPTEDSAKVTDEVDQTLIEEKSFEQQPVQDAQIEELANRIRTLMEEKKLYLRHDLKSKDIIKDLGTNHYYFSLAFSSMNSTFADYVNEMRIKYAVMLMNQNKEMKLSGIMIESGYTSEASFFRNFKRFMGCTPRQYSTNLDTTAITKP